MYDELEQGGVFKNHPQLFLTGIVVGILTGKSSEEKKDYGDLIRLETYEDNDPEGIVPTYLVAINPGMTQKELARLMESYADAGIEALYNEFKSTGKVDFVKLSELGNG